MARTDTPRGPATEALLRKLAAGKSTVEAAQAAGVSLRTARRRLADEGFRARLRDLQRQATQEAARSLASAASEAARRLRRLLDDEDPWIALGAARAILTAAMDWAATADLEERIAALEGRAKRRAT